MAVASEVSLLIVIVCRRIDELVLKHTESTAVFCTVEDLRVKCTYKYNVEIVCGRFGVLGPLRHLCALLNLAEEQTTYATWCLLGDFDIIITAPSVVVLVAVFVPSTTTSSSL